MSEKNLEVVILERKGTGDSYAVIVDNDDKSIYKVLGFLGDTISGSNPTLEEAKFKLLGRTHTDAV